MKFGPWVVVAIFHVVKLTGNKEEGYSERKLESLLRDFDYVNKTAHCFHVKGVAKSGTTWLQTLLNRMKKLNCENTFEAMNSDVCTKGRCERFHQGEKHMTKVVKSEKESLPVFIFRDSRDVVVR